jgi:polyhydroxyalkanoate synthesis repressor PhaR
VQYAGFWASPENNERGGPYRETFMRTPRGAAGPAAGEPAVIRKYANRRLYDTSRGRCVTLADLARRLRKGKAVRVTEVSSGSDVTRQVLAQILCEAETAAGPRALLDEALLARLIGCSGATNVDHLRAALHQAIDRVEGGGTTATGATGSLRPRGTPATRAAIARIDALQVRLRALIDDAGTSRHAAKKD